MHWLGDILLEKKIGKGTYSDVYIGKKINTNEVYAVKKMDKSQCLKESVRKYFNNEIFILKNVHHDNIMKLYDIKQSDKDVFLITEYCNGGELFKLLQKYMKVYRKPFTQDIVQHLMRQIVSGVQYLHNRKIIHRDLKLDNILVNFNNVFDLQNMNLLNAKVKIIDFGFARLIPEGNIALSILGSPINMSPEILENLQRYGEYGDNAKKNPYDFKADIYSLGTICYEMLVGVPPFDTDQLDDLVTKVKQGTYNIPSSLHLSREAISFINGMLQYVPEKRLNINELANHDFLTKDWRTFTPIQITSNQNMLFNIKDFRNARRGVWDLYKSLNNLNLNEINARMVRQFDQRQYEVNGIRATPIDYLGNLQSEEKTTFTALTGQMLAPKQAAFPNSAILPNNGNIVNIANVGNAGNLNALTQPVQALNTNQINNLQTIISQPQIPQVNTLSNNNAILTNNLAINQPQTTVFNNANAILNNQTYNNTTVTNNNTSNFAFDTINMNLQPQLNLNTLYPKTPAVPQQIQPISQIQPLSPISNLSNISNLQPQPLVSNNGFFNTTSNIALGNNQNFNLNNGTLAGFGLGTPIASGGDIWAGLNLVNLGQFGGNNKVWI